MDSPNGRNAKIYSVLSFPELIWLIRSVEVTPIYLNIPQPAPSLGVSAVLGHLLCFLCLSTPWYCFFLGMSERFPGFRLIVTLSQNGALHLTALASQICANFQGIWGIKHYSVPDLHPYWLSGASTACIEACYVSPCTFKVFQDIIAVYLVV